jgi:hypothetical protein
MRSHKVVLKVHDFVLVNGAVVEENPLVHGLNVVKRCSRYEVDKFRYKFFEELRGNVVFILTAQALCDLLVLELQSFSVVSNVGRSQGLNLFLGVC